MFYYEDKKLCMVVAYVCEEDFARTKVATTLANHDFPALGVRRLTTVFKYSGKLQFSTTVIENSGVMRVGLMACFFFL